MRHINFSDDLERRVAIILDRNNIEFLHESEVDDQRLDFYLPNYGVYIEVKRFDSARTSTQLSSQENIILIQGRQSINFLEKLL